MKTVGLKNLCQPALLYLVLNLVGMFMFYIQFVGGNIMKDNMSFVIQFIYILFWTWILNIVCSLGFEMIAWGLFLFSFGLLYAMLGYQMI
jgi:hypothetical protein